MLTRRFFLGGAIALTVAARAIPISAPRIVGDGVHDDTAGLQALLSNEPYECDLPNVGWLSNSGRIYIQGGIFRLTDIIYIRRNNVYLFDGQLLAEHPKTVLVFDGVSGCHLHGLNIRSQA